MPGIGEGGDGALAAGVSTTKKGRRQSMRRSFDSITAEKSNALYQNANMFTLKDSHIHSVAEALKESEKLMMDKKQDPDKHKALLGEFMSFSKQNLVPPPSLRDNDVTGADLVGARRGSVAIPGKANRRMTQRRSFDGATSKR